MIRNRLKTADIHCLLSRDIDFTRQPLKFRTEWVLQVPTGPLKACYYLTSFFLWWYLGDFSLPTSFDAVFQGGRLPTA
jgi:hypothetical protein